MAFLGHYVTAMSLSETSTISESLPRPVTMLTSNLRLYLKQAVNV